MSNRHSEICGRADLSTELISWDARSDSFVQEWEELYASADRYGPTYAPVFAITELSSAKNPVLAIVRKSGCLAAVLPLESRSLGLFRYAQILPRKEIGYSGVVASSQEDDDVYVELGCFLASRFSFIVSSQNERSACLTNALIQWFVRDGGISISVSRAIRHYMLLGCSYQQFMENNKSAKSRSTLRRRIRVLNDKYNVDIEQYAAEEIDDRLIDRAHKIQKSSWMNRRGAAKIGNQDVRALLLKLSKSGLIKAWFMKIDGEDAAMIFNYEAHGKIYFKYPAFSLKYQNDSIGQVLLSHVVEDACSRGVSCMDLGHGGGFNPTEYKRWWGTNVETVDRVAMGSTLVGNLCAMTIGMYWTLRRYNHLRKLRLFVKSLFNSAKRANTE